MSASAASAFASRGARWGAVVLALALVPVAGVFTLSKIFYVRDLSFFFWSRHLWLRHTVFSGVFPLWDPYVAGGQSALPDALNQLLMPITLAIRLLPSDVVSFNLWVALPLPIVAIGTYAFLRRTCSDPASAVGAIAFALSGPIVSMLNTPNLAWSVAAMPYVMLAADRVIVAPTAPRVSLLALVVALQALCGEPVTLAATAAMGTVFALWRSFTPGDDAASEVRTDRRSENPVSRGRTMGLVVAGFLGGALLGAAQLWPTMLAGWRAHRGNMAAPDFWSLHPLGALELLAPHLFGNYYDAFLADMPWMSPFNSGREPFYYSIYCGPIVLALAAAGLIARPRRNLGWAILAVVFFAAAMGGYTPFYPLVRKLVPPVTYFRFPVKYLVITTFATAVLVAEGWSALTDATRWKRIRYVAALCVLAAILVGSAMAMMLAAPELAEPAIAGVAHRVGVEAQAGTAYLLRVAPPLGARAGGLLLAAAALLIIAASSRSRARAAAYLLAAAMATDLAVTNAELNLTAPVNRFSPPDWYRALAGEQRVYIGGRVRGYMNASDPDGSKRWEIPAEDTAIEGRMELNADLPMAPSGFRVREALSYDLPVLWPAEYEAVVRRFEHATAGERDLFLKRAAVRWCVLPDTARPWLEPIARVPRWTMAVVDCHPDATRVFITPTAHEGDDPGWQRSALFDATAPDDELRIARMPRLAGAAGGPVAASARIVADGANEVVIEAGLSGDGFVVLRDSYDPSWQVEVDGTRAEMARANGLYRAVRVAAGRHVIRFRFRPRDLFAGLTLSVMTGILLMVGSWPWRSRRRMTERGFTLVELLIVVAIIGIILAIAFAQYRGMQTRGNETSAMASLRSIAAAEWQFAQTCGSQKYASSLTALGQPAPTTGQAFLSPDLTAADQVEKSGYMFKITAKPIDGAAPACNGTPVSEGYAATADPTRPGFSGNRFFAMNADRVLYEDVDTFTEKMPEEGNPGKGTEIK